MAMVRAPRARLEEIEQLEQLRMLELGRSVLCVEVSTAGRSVDTPEDVVAILRELAS
jgi:3-deoxy-manno-octulosonate cytidylyltransferase (CMP-KDO synthetase)